MSLKETFGRPEMPFIKMMGLKWTKKWNFEILKGKTLTNVKFFPRELRGKIFRGSLPPNYHLYENQEEDHSKTIFGPGS